MFTFSKSQNNTKEDVIVLGFFDNMFFELGILNVILITKNLSVGAEQ